jgi:hypothetical protein
MPWLSVNQFSHSAPAVAATARDSREFSTEGPGVSRIVFMIE